MLDQFYAFIGVLEFGYAGDKTCAGLADGFTYGSPPHIKR